MNDVQVIKANRNENRIRGRKVMILGRVSYLKKKKDEITIRSSAAEYLTYVASVGDQQDSIEMRYEDENICLTLISTCWNLKRMLRSSSIAIKIFSLPRSSAWKLGHQSGQK